MSTQEIKIDKTIQINTAVEKTMQLDKSGGTTDRTIQIGQAHHPSSDIPSVEKPDSVSDTATIKTADKKNLTSTFLVNTLRLFERTQDVNTVIPEPQKFKMNVVTNLNDMERITLKEITENFSVDAPFATGGQGLISKGRDQTLKRMVAVKTLRKELCGDEEQRRSFLTEARVTAQLEHPAIIPVYGLHSKGENSLAVTMKLVHGHTLKEYMEHVSKRYSEAGKKHRYNEQKALRYRLDIFLKICDALDYAHNRNIMHCDLKPENIMIGEYNEAYLMDWGIATKIYPEAEVNTDHYRRQDKIRGTPRFLAPERVCGERGDARSDIFAMGLILYEIVSFNEAFTGNDADEIVQNIANYDIRPLKHKFGYPIDKDLKAIIRKATEFYALDRYSSIKAFASDIRKYLDNEEVKANPDTIFRKMFRFCILRHGKATVITTLISLLAIAGIGAFELRDSLNQEKIDKRRQVQIGLQFIESLRTAYTFDREILSWEQNVEDIGERITFLLEHEHSEKVKVKRVDNLCPIEKYNDPELAPSSYRMYAQRNKKLDFDRIAYRVLPDTDKTKVDMRLNAAANLLPNFQNLLMSTPFGIRLTKRNRNKLLLNMLNSKVPGCLAYFAFEDGMYFCYPGKDNDLGYDPRQRRWYQERIRIDAPHAGWSAPYLDYQKKETVMTYSVRLEDNVTGKPIGVVAMDINLLEPLQELLGDIREKPFILEKTFLDSRGAVIVTTNKRLSAEADRQYRKSASGDAEPFHYPDKELVAEMWKRSNGYISRLENGKPIIYVFSKCQTVDWYYFEKIDVKENLKQYEKVRPEH